MESANKFCLLLLDSSYRCLFVLCLFLYIVIVIVVLVFVIVFGISFNDVPARSKALIVLIKCLIVLGPKKEKETKRKEKKTNERHMDNKEIE